MKKPARSDEYSPQQLTAVRAACAELMSTLGELLEEMVIVGGLVPSLLIDAAHTRGETHVGTLDLDLGLQFGLSQRAHYHRLAKRLREQGFAPAQNEKGEMTPYRWGSGSTLVDFLVASDQPRARAGSLVAIDDHLEAVVTPALRLAFKDREWVDAWWHEGSKLPVCGPGAFVVLKALAFHARHASKDAYDLHYVVSHFGAGVEDVAARLRPLLDDGHALEAVQLLREDFADLDAGGPVAVALFTQRADDEGHRADVAGIVRQLVESL